MTKNIKITINGFPIEVKSGTTLLEAAEELGIRIPTLCYHKDLCVAGNCRVCMVEVTGQKRLSAACATPCEEGLEIPLDYSVVVRVPMDSRGGWKLLIAKEIKQAGIEIDLNKLI